MSRRGSPARGVVPHQHAPHRAGPHHRRDVSNRRGHHLGRYRAQHENHRGDVHARRRHVIRQGFARDVAHEGVHARRLARRKRLSTSPHQLLQRRYVPVQLHSNQYYTHLTTITACSIPATTPHFSTLHPFQFIQASRHHKSSILNRRVCHVYATRIPHAYHVYNTYIPRVCHVYIHTYLRMYTSSLARLFMTHSERANERILERV